MDESFLWICHILPRFISLPPRHDLSPQVQWAQTSSTSCPLISWTWINSSNYTSSVPLSGVVKPQPLKPHKHTSVLGHIPPVSVIWALNTWRTFSHLTSESSHYSHQLSTSTTSSRVSVIQWRSFKTLSWSRRIYPVQEIFTLLNLQQWCSRNVLKEGKPPKSSSQHQGFMNNGPGEDSQ